MTRPSATRRRERPLRLWAGIFLAILFLAAGCATQTRTAPVSEAEIPVVEEETPPAAPAPPADAAQRRYRIGPKDGLKILVFRRPDLSKDTPVRDDGTIFLPLAGKIVAEGKTVTELADEITARLAPYVRDPQVDVIVAQPLAHTFSLLGEFKMPGVFPLREDTTLVEAIGAGQGLTEKANLSGAYLVRRGTILPVDFYALFRRGDVSQNVLLEDRDFIYVPSRELMRVFVIGEVRQPQVVQMNEGRLTLLEAIAAAGGFDERTAYKSNVKVIRGGLAHPTVMTVNLKDFLRGRPAKDVELESGDIVFVPASAVTKWDRVLGQLLPTLSQIVVDAAAVQSLSR